MPEAVSLVADAPPGRCVPGQRGCAIIGFVARLDMSLEALEVSEHLQRPHFLRRCSVLAVQNLQPFGAAPARLLVGIAETRLVGGLEEIVHRLRPLGALCVMPRERLEERLNALRVCLLRIVT